MIRTYRRLFSASAAALALGLLAPFAQAASISYGNFGPVAPGISFLNVTESSGTDPVPLYGAPDPYSSVVAPGPVYEAGLDFDPTSFVASAAGGGADITDGQLNFTIVGQKDGLDVVAIKSIFLSEGGDYTLVGGGTAASQVLAGAIMAVKVTEIDGSPVTPFSLPAANSSVGFNLAANGGIVQPWSLGVLVDLEAQLLSLNKSFIVGVTKAEVVINNSLIAISEPGSIAFIAKKDFVIGTAPKPGILPEPGTLGMMGLALCGIGAASRRKRS
ncbi:PEP-CTERM sorting domain-containing protein [Lacipirellula limnantheis]|uniref:PEP-CTERM motif protein n=1 Tax=Lacipirellula limnantheis TaxID=2528024 RepID=A0A517TXE2_9BACT|nr:PEP-CTERM sorting domain-containing protein [Lacipirellula limnantheis]QDT73041.1 PEP-CTERM motif protein [Lacipirellula limnantheis]